MDFRDFARSGVEDAVGALSSIFTPFSPGASTLHAPPAVSSVIPVKPKRVVDPARRANQLSGKDWLKNSISVWSGLLKTREERALKHPAAYPGALVRRLLDSFLNKADSLVLDPFLGSGTTAVAACQAGHRCVGLELYPAFARVARERVAEFGGRATVVQGSLFSLGEHVAPGSVDMVVTSPPYWSVLNRKRTADAKATRTYGKAGEDLGNIEDYETFLDKLCEGFGQVLEAMRPGAYCVVNVMDLRVGPKFYPFHSDLYTRMQRLGFELDDIVIWDRRLDYNCLKPLGFPYKFRLNRVHEYLLVFVKPSSLATARHKPAQGRRKV